MDIVERSVQSVDPDKGNRYLKLFFLTF